MPLLSPTQLFASIVAMIGVELLHLKWIWLSEWNCRRCKQKNLQCECSGRWLRYL